MNNGFEQENLCELSYELLYLLQWLTRNEPHTLKKLITKALNDGFNQKLQGAKQTKELIQSEDVNNSIVDFLDLVDSLLHESLEEKNIQDAYQKNLMPSLNKIDTTLCDNATVRGSLNSTTTHLEQHPETNPKEHLFKELLKRWKPQNKKTLH